MIKCYNCENEITISDKVFFCPNCLTQVKCKNCGELLEKNANGCVTCGMPLIIVSSEKKELNQIEFEQKGDTKKFKATFSDSVGQDLVATFGGIVGVPISKGRLLQGKERSLTLNSNLSSTSTIDIEEAEFKEENNLDEALLRVFKIDGESLIIQTSNFKSSSKLDKEKRIALLTLLGYRYLHNAEEIKRRIITNMLNNFKLNSGSFRNWIGKSEEIGQKNGGLIFLTPNGLQTAIDILKEVVEQSTEKGKVIISKQNTPQRKSIGNSTESRKSIKGSKEYLLDLITEGYFKERRNLSDIVSYIKDNKAITFKTTDISGHMGKFVSKKVLKRGKGESGNYEYFI